MMNRNLKELTKNLIVLENEIQDLYAQSTHSQFGKFIPELSLAEFNFSKEEIEVLCSVSFRDDSTDNELKTLARQFLQTWYHEYFHFFQQITLRGMRKFARIRKNKLKAETAILIKAAELKCIWNVGNKNHRQIYPIIHHENFPPHDFPGGEIERHLRSFQVETSGWTSKKHGEISFLEIIEGMAHCFSKFLFNFEDFLNLDGVHVYSNAYNYFLGKGGKLIEGQITRDFIFCYICYFSLKEENTDDTLCFFVRTCDNLLDCIKAMRNCYPADEVKLLIENFSNWLGREHAYNDARLKTLGQFIGCINYLRDNLQKQDHNSNGFGENEFTVDEKAVIDFSIPQGIGINEDYLLMLFLAFPGSFFMWSQKLRDPQEKFVLNFKALINPFLPNAWCCENHKYSANESTILHCSDENSFASIFFDLTGSQLFECVKLPTI